MCINFNSLVCRYCYYFHVINEKVEAQSGKLTKQESGQSGCPNGSSQFHAGWGELGINWCMKSDIFDRFSITHKHKGLFLDSGDGTTPFFRFYGLLFPWWLQGCVNHTTHHPQGGRFSLSDPSWTTMLYISPRHVLVWEAHCDLWTSLWTLAWTCLSTVKWWLSWQSGRMYHLTYNII